MKNNRLIVGMFHLFYSLKISLNVAEKNTFSATDDEEVKFSFLPTHRDSCMVFSSQGQYSQIKRLYSVLETRLGGARCTY